MGGGGGGGGGGVCGDMGYVVGQVLCPSVYMYYMATGDFILYK